VSHAEPVRTSALSTLGGAVVQISAVDLEPYQKSEVGRGCWFLGVQESPGDSSLG
jgi:hypothetical protein